MMPAMLHLHNKPTSKDQEVVVMLQHNIGAPFESITIDITGPFRESGRGTDTS
jgi:hypothetical protein